jgi:tripartite-type tricarboxylate transporter receptor subunit TctC
MRRLRALPVVLAASLLAGGCGDGSNDTASPGDSAESFPSERVRLIVPYTAGGPTDIAGRALGEFFQKDLGETVIVENKPGASGATGYQALIASESDGHTISMLALPTAVLNYLSNDVGYTREDLVPVGVVTQVPSGLVVPADSPHKTIEDLFAAAKAEPGSIGVGTPGATNTHAAETRRITSVYGVPLTVVPFNGNAEVKTALLGGNVPAGFVNLSQDMLPAIESGELRVLGVGTQKPLSYVDAPTFADQGYPELVHSTTTFGLVVPRGTPEEVVSRLEESLQKALADPAVVKKLDERYVPEQFLGSADLAGLFDQTEETFREVARQK